MSDRKKIVEASRRQASLKPAGAIKRLASISLDRPLTIIGSGRCAHVRLRSKSISRVHAACLNLDGRVYLKDLASRGGTIVNGKPVQNVYLRNGDRIQLGSASFEFIDDDPCAADEPRPVSAHFGTKGGSDHLVEQPIILIGHRGTADFTIPHEDVSSAHAIIFSILGEWMLRDLDSRSGTFVNGVRVRQKVLHPRDVIGIGPGQITFEPGESSAALSRPEAPETSTAELEDQVAAPPESVARVLPEANDLVVRGEEDGTSASEYSPRVSESSTLDAGVEAHTDTIPGPDASEIDARDQVTAVEMQDPEEEMVVSQPETGESTNRSVAVREVDSVADNSVAEDRVSAIPDEFDSDVPPLKEFEPSPDAGSSKARSDVRSEDLIPLPNNPPSTLPSASSVEEYFGTANTDTGNVPTGQPAVGTGLMPELVLPDTEVPESGDERTSTTDGTMRTGSDNATPRADMDFEVSRGEALVDEQLTQNVREWGPVAMAVFAAMHPTTSVDTSSEEDAPPLAHRRSVPRYAVTVGVAAVILLASILFYGVSMSLR